MRSPVEQRRDKEIGDRVAPPTVFKHAGAAALVITSSESERIFLRAALDGLLCNLHFASNRFEADAVLAAESVAVVMVDGDAKAFSWRELLGQISGPDLGPAPKLIVTSCEADDRTWAEVINLGAYDLLPKPLDAGEVAWVVRSALTEWTSGRNRVRRAETKEQGVWNGCWQSY